MYTQDSFDTGSLALPAAAAWVRLGRMPTGSESTARTPGLGESRFCHSTAGTAAGNPSQTCRTSNPPGPLSVASGPLPCCGGETTITYIRTLRFKSALTQARNFIHAASRARAGHTVRVAPNVPCGSACSTVRRVLRAESRRCR
jgi:hypothetical protein